MRHSLRAQNTADFYRPERDTYKHGYDQDDESEETEEYGYSGVLRDITNFDRDDIRTLSEENDQFRSNIDSQYYKARKLLQEAEEEGYKWADFLKREEIESLKRENQEKVHRLEDLLIELDTLTGENKILFDQLDAKVIRVNHLQAHIKTINQGVQEEGNKMYTELCRKKKQNSDSQSLLTELQNEITKLLKLVKRKEEEANKLSAQCKQLLSDKSMKMDSLKSISKKLDELTDKVEEVQQLIANLKRKNNRREKDINKMAQKADELMK